MHVKTSFFLASLSLLLGVIVAFCSYTSTLNPGNTFCQTEGVRHLAPWTSGCIYQAYFEKSPSKDSILYEQKKLAYFAERGGVAADVLWYRSVFHQRFQNELRTPFQDIHEMHLQYTRAQHIRIDLQMNYLQFLLERDLAPLAQTTLDEYCETYIPHKRSDLLEEINWRLGRRGLALSSASCEAKVAQ